MNAKTLPTSPFSHANVRVLVQMFEPRCNARRDLTFGCGTSRQRAQITFWKCGLPDGHEGPHHDALVGETWPTPEEIEDKLILARLRARLRNPEQIRAGSGMEP